MVVLAQVPDTAELESTRIKYRESSATGIALCRNQSLRNRLPSKLLNARSTGPRVQKHKSARCSIIDQDPTHSKQKLQHVSKSKIKVDGHRKASISSVARSRNRGQIPAQVNRIRVCRQDFKQGYSCCKENKVPRKRRNPPKNNQKKPWCRKSSILQKARY
ncbi:hypothetical protein BD289DRAFT_236361 [Coniella lustricola]|uniref:Uncharacterized protein n=1 Tax=Coniella lustricola TaxID=2025994 RepID=A0A2T3A9P5_9PEZI|nr:hypothetical protein BD289DRAFT_236361 [Coniella lustricola]